MDPRVTQNSPGTHPNPSRQRTPPLKSLHIEEDFINLLLAGLLVELYMYK